MRLSAMKVRIAASGALARRHEGIGIALRRAVDLRALRR